MDASLLQSPQPILEQFAIEAKKRCDGFEAISEDDFRYIFLHVLERLVQTDPSTVRLGYRLYSNDHLKLDLVVRYHLMHLMACEFKVHLSGSGSRKKAWDVLDDLSRLSLANLMMSSLSNGLPSYFVYLYSTSMLEFFERKTPRLFSLINAPIGTSIAFDVLTQIEIEQPDMSNLTRPKRPRHELDLHQGVAVCIQREHIYKDSERCWMVAVFSVTGDKILAMDY